MTEQCPVLWLEEYATVAHAHVFLKQGILPHAGGWAEQPGPLMQMVTAFGNNTTI